MFGFINSKLRSSKNGLAGRSLALAAAFILVFTSFSLCFADGDGDIQGVYDPAGVLSDGQYLALNTAAEKIMEESGMGIYAVAVDDYMDYASYDGQDVVSAAGDIFYENDFGLGDNHDGILLLVSMMDRDYAFFTCGEGETLFSGSTMDAIEDNLLSHFRENDWYGGFTGYIQDCADALGIDIDVAGYYELFEEYDENNEWQGNYSGDSAEGKSGNPLMRILIGCVLGGVAGSVASVSINRASKRNMMNTFQKRDAEGYAVSGSYNITVEDEKFVRNDIARILAAAAVGAAAGAASANGRNKGGGPKISHGGSLSRGSGGFSSGRGFSGGGGFRGGGGRGGKF